MSRILNNCTIISELNKNNTINAGCKVTTESELLSLEVVGFIPFNQMDFYDITKFIIGYNTIRFDLDVWGNKKEHRFLPITKKIEKKHNDKLIIDNGFLYIANIESADRTNLNLYLKYVGTSGNYELSKNKLLRTKHFIAEEDNVFYLIKEEEMLVLRGDRIIGVSDYFLCLCSYINQITGKVEYLIKNPDELIIVLQKDK